MQLQQKSINQTWKNGKKPSFYLILAPLVKFGHQKFSSWMLPLPDVRHCCKLSLYLISRKTNEPNLRKWQKTWAAKIFWKTWLCQPLDTMASYHHVQYQKTLMIQSWENSCPISENTNDPILRKLSYKRTGGLTVWQRDRWTNRGTGGRTER